MKRPILTSAQIKRAHMGYSQFDLAIARGRFDHIYYEKGCLRISTDLLTIRCTPKETKLIQAGDWRGLERHIKIVRARQTWLKAAGAARRARQEYLELRGKRDGRK